MTSTICSNATENDSKQLIDKRDGKKYWVTKLKDNNCWMTQNLDLDIEANKIYTSADTDLENAASKQWQAPADAGTIPEGTILNSTDVWPGTNNIIKSYDPGDYVYATPLLENKCPNSSNGLAGCVGHGWANVTNGVPSTDTNWTGSVDYFTKTYNAHYLAGNYYSWGTATAGQAANIGASGEATQSICPSGWRLPPSGSNTTDKSYSKLTAAYGIGNSASGTTALRQSPLYFLYGGSVSDGSLTLAGSQGRYWSSTAYDASRAYYLNFTSINSSYVVPSNYYNRYYGLSVRCVAR